MKKDFSQLKKDLNEFGIELTAEMEEQFLLYYNMLIEWNSFMNLTAITDFDEVLKKHFTDSVSLIRAIPDLAEKRFKVIDVGTGAGFPGIPLKIVFPNISVVLLDSLNKRVNFLNEVISKLQLTDIIAMHGRAEDFAQNKEYRESFDLCVSRAVSGLATLSEYCLPYVKKGGIFVSYKSGSVQEEVEAAKRAVEILGGKIRDVQYFELPGEIGRSLVVIEKIKNTPARYPRKAGTPLREPLT